MDKEIKKRLKSVGKLLWHIGIPTIIVFYILDVWTNSLSNSASNSWNIFVTVACFGAIILILLFSLLIEFCLWVYIYKSKDW